MKKQKKTKREPKLKVGDVVCNMDEFLGDCNHPEYPKFKIECKYNQMPLGKCKYKEACDFQKEVDEQDAKDWPDIIDGEK